MGRAALVLILTARARAELRQLLKNGVLPVRTVIRTLALLRVDEGLSSPRVAGILELTGQGVRQIVKRYEAGGLDVAVYEGPRPGNKPALDAAQMQRVIASACGPPPPGQARRSVRLFPVEVHKRYLVPGVGREVIRIETGLSRRKRSSIVLHVSLVVLPCFLAVLSEFALFHA